MRVLHQAGHNTIWNVHSYTEDNAGDGIIFSPLHLQKGRLESDISQSVKSSSLFDPQFYVPDSQKNKLHSYDFFPERLMNGFTTVDFEAQAYNAAEQCLNFQMHHDFESLIIPARFFPDLISNYIQQQRILFVDPFLHAYEKRGATKKLFLTLPLTASMLLDSEYRTAILDWATSYQEITGIYLLVFLGETSKQIKNYEKLSAYASFINDIHEADLNVICGYCNTEGLLFSILDVHAVTMGAYENTRNFSIDKFLEDDQERRGPAARIFLPKLLNWIRWSTAEEIRSDFPDLWEKVYTPTDYSEQVFSTGQPPHFTQPALYKHHFTLMSELYAELSQGSPATRKACLTEKIKTAGMLYGEIEDRGVMFFDDNCAGTHLSIWNRVLRKMPPVVGG